VHIVTLSCDDGFERSSIRTAEIFERHGLVAELNVIAAGHQGKPDENGIANGTTATSTSETSSRRAATT
jgi:hypothetical protein